MKRFSVFIWAALFSGAALFMGCSPKWVGSAPVVKQADLLVRLEHKVDKDRVIEQEFNHPFDIGLGDMETLLTHLDYLDEYVLYGEPDRKPVFQKKEADRLAPALCSALAKATPDQRVRFVSYNTGGGFLFLKKRRKTGGVVFVENGGRLNIAFGYVNREIRETSDLRKFPEGNAFSDPLAFGSCDTPIIAPDYAVHQRTQDGEAYPMWIVAEVEKIEEQAVSASEPEADKPQPAATPDTSAKPEAGPESETASGPEKAVKDKPEAKPAPEKAVKEKKAPAHEPSLEESGDSWQGRKKDIKEKLKYLKELYDSDLIDKKEYGDQKKKLLNRLSE